MSTLWEKMQTLQAFQKKNKLPESPGVYFFLDAKKKLLYIGKATSLRDRVKSYFLRGIEGARGPKIELMLEKVRFVAHRKTDSVLEALILEASLIKDHQPPYNTDAKDDKSYNHVVITEELFPRVLIARGRDLLSSQPASTRGDSSTRLDSARLARGGQLTANSKQKKEYKYIFGPFPAGGALREAMKIVRKLFPYRDRCLPAKASATEGEPTDNLQLITNTKKISPCFNRQIGLCPGVCTGEISPREYARTINHIRLFFEGHKNTLIKNLKREMKTAVKHLAFEHAGEIKKTLFGLQHIQDVALVKEDSRLTTDDSQQGMRIEAYDVAHLGGSASVGAMMVLQNGRPAKEFYRKFTLRGGHQGNDLTALQEILERRLQHSEWPLPEIIVVDGAEPQVAVAKRAIYLEVRPPSDIAVVGVVKNAKHQPERLIGSEALVKRFKKEILLANSEAHRFAITFHRARRGKEFLST
ncbi:MAG: GIY-YIG nuclease family protein [bacterium]|nr:GIY-YIG nuclease family protein [bacterium]